jgi:pSer/pThr/pTyr-binding forkhead associated (FHA) protein
MAVCTHCGRASQGYERFCMSCGQPLDSGASAAVAAAVSPSGTPVWQRTGAVEPSPEAEGPEAQPRAASGNGVHADAAVATSPRSRLIVHRLATADGGSEDGPSIEVGEFILDGRDIAIGRAPSCDIVLEGDQLASRRHALFRSRSDGYTVVDLGSSNGTYINDLEIREAVLLHEGDHISIGGHELIYSTSPAGPHASLAGVKMTEPEPPAGPMVDTDPNAMAASARDTAESAAVAVAGAAAAAVDTASASSDDAGIAVPSPLAGADVDQADGAGDPGEPGEGYAAPPSDDEQVGEEEALVVPSVAPHTVNSSTPLPEADFGNSSITDYDFEALRMQLAEVSEALARKATAETRVIRQLRGALASARDQLAALVSESSAAGLSGSSPALPPDLAELVSIARQAADNPRHLDYLTALAEHASEIADALESSSSTTSPATGGIQTPELEALRARLDEALG